MKKIFAIHSTDDIFAVVKAESKEEVIDIFAKSKVNDSIYREYLTEFIVNTTLLEKFYRDDQGYFLHQITGDYKSHLIEMNDEERELYIDGWIEKNVREYWKDQPQFADEYLNELNKNNDDIPQFSDEYMIYNVKRLLSDKRWCDFEIVEIDLSENDYQVIWEA